jgi:hypothetical protein
MNLTSTGMEHYRAKIHKAVNRIHEGRAAGGLNYFFYAHTIR